MKLKLLPRKEIDTLKAKERQTEINEGAKLAGRVDGLRKLQAEEEVHLNKWRNETLSTIQSEIDRMLKEKDIVNVQLIDKKKELENALVPLQMKEMHLEKEQEKLSVSFIEVELQKANLDEVIQMNEALRSLNEKELLSRSLEKQEYERMFEEANSQLGEAESILSASKEQARNTRESAETIRARAVKRENEVAQWQKELELKANVLSMKEAELEQRELDVIVKELLFNSPIKYGQSSKPHATSDR